MCQLGTRGWGKHGGGGGGKGTTLHQARLCIHLAHGLITKTGLIPADDSITETEEHSTERGAFHRRRTGSLPGGDVWAGSWRMGGRWMGGVNTEKTLKTCGPLTGPLPVQHRSRRQTSEAREPHIPNQGCTGGSFGNPVFRIHMSSRSQDIKRQIFRSRAWSRAHGNFWPAALLKHWPTLLTHCSKGVKWGLERACVILSVTQGQLLSIHLATQQWIKHNTHPH